LDGFQQLHAAQINASSNQTDEQRNQNRPPNVGFQSKNSFPAAGI
jgi:hypothetical protein